MVMTYLVSRMEIIDNDEIISKRPRNKLDTLATCHIISGKTYQGVQKDVETGSCIHLWKLHHGIELKRSDFETGVTVPLAVHVGKLFVKFVSLLRELKSFG